MNHDEALELLEVAAAEPHGLDRLLGGTSAEGAAVAEHLEGCDSCRAELDALRRVAALTAEVVQATPRPELREQTLSYVAAVGRARSAGMVGGVAESATTGPRRWSFRWPSFAWGASFGTGLAAVVLIAALVVGQARDADLRNANAAIAQQQRAIAGLANVTNWSMRVAAEPDAEAVRLAAAAGGAQQATVMYSAAGREVVMVASGLTAPTGDQEYRCWVESGGQRKLIGRMNFDANIAYWAGAAYALPTGHVTFGVSLVSTSTSGAGGGQVVLTGSS